jgi:putative membrane protein
VHAVDQMLRCRRRLSGAALVAVTLILFDPQAARAEPGVPVPPNGLLTDRGKGSVSDADRDFAVKVRLAGLWEIPAGEMAQEKSDDPRIQSIGRDIAAQHIALDKLVRDAAKKLDIDLPNKPNADQQTWLAEMRDAEGEDFDRVYIDRLRAAHGKIFPAIATIRASTRNDTVRKLAQRTNQFVMTHMTLLESSGIVDFAALPTAPPPAAATGGSAGAAQFPPTATSGASLSVAGTPVLAIVVVALASAAVTAFAFRHLTRDSRRSYRRQRNRYYEA